jgi:tetratricopeptide (TPR) repeat protein
MRMSHRKWLVLLVLLVAGLGAVGRWLWFSEIAGTTLLQVPQLDAADYRERALAVLAGQGWPGQPFWQGPLYPLLLAGVYGIFGAVGAAPQVLQLLLTALLPLLTFLLARRLAGTGAGLAAAALCALYGPPVFYAAFLLPAVPLTVLVLLFAGLCTRLVGGEDRRLALAAGLVAGAAALMRGNALLLLAAPPLLLLFGRRPPRVILRASAWLLLGAALCILPATVRNLVVGRDLVLISSNAGLNLWLGQQSEYGGIFGPVHMRPDQEHDPTGGRQLEMELGRQLKPSEVSRIYTGRALRRLVAEPLPMLVHHARKAYRFWNGYELPQIASYDHHRERSTGLRLLPVPFLLLASLGLVGAARARTLEERAVALVVGLYFLSLLPFFPTARYRQPVAPLLAVLAALAVRDAWRCWRARDRRGLSLVVAPAAALTLALLPAWGALDRAEVEWRALINEAAREARLGRADAVRRLVQRADAVLPAAPATFHAAGLLWEELGEDADAARAFARCADLAPAEALPLYRLGRALHRLGRLDEALAAFRRARELDPAWDKPCFGEAMVLRERGDLARAVEAMEEAVRLNPGAVHQRSNLASLLAEAGRLDEARRLLADTVASFPGYAKGWINLALVELNLGDRPAAAEALARSARVRALTDEERDAIERLKASLATGRQAGPPTRPPAGN